MLLKEIIVEVCKKDEFDYIWERSVLNSIAKCQKELDKAFQEKVSLTTPCKSIYKKELSKIYHRKREWLKKTYLPNSDQAMLDFHKLSAIMCRSIIGHKFFKFDVEKAKAFLVSTHQKVNTNAISAYQALTLEIDNVYVNYKLAFLVAESIAYEDLIAWSDFYADEFKKIASEKDKKSIVFSKVYEDFSKYLISDLKKLHDYPLNYKHDPLYESIVISLAKNDILQRDFDYLSFSAILYQWQEYTKRVVFNDIICNQDYINEQINIDSILSPKLPQMKN